MLSAHGLHMHMSHPAHQIRACARLHNVHKWSFGHKLVHKCACMRNHLILYCSLLYSINQQPQLLAFDIYFCGQWRNLQHQRIFQPRVLQNLKLCLIQKCLLSSHVQSSWKSCIYWIKWIRGDWRATGARMQPRLHFLPSIFSSADIGIESAWNAQCTCMICATVCIFSHSVHMHLHIVHTYAWYAH